MRTTDRQTDERMDQSFTVTWSVTTAFYEAIVAPKVGKNLKGARAPLRGPSLATVLRNCTFPETNW